MSEYNPDLHLEDDGEEIPFNRETAGLYKFLGEWATHDHIFIVVDENEETANGLYIFKSNPNYRALVKYMIDSRFIIHMNLPEPSRMDLQAFEMAHYRDVKDFPPEVWPDTLPKIPEGYDG